MNIVNFSTKSALVVVGSILALSACGKKHDDNKDDITTKISQPYNTKNQIVAHAQGGADGAKVSCSGVQKITLITGESDDDTFTFTGVYSSNGVNFNSITQKNKNGDEVTSDLDQFQISGQCFAYNMSKLVGVKDWTYAFTSCTDDSGKKYEITSSTPVSGAQLWCNQ